MKKRPYEVILENLKKRRLEEDGINVDERLENYVKKINSRLTTKKHIKKAMPELLDKI
jgi:hypothetical protein